MNGSEHLESLLAPLRASFHAKRRDRIGIADQISNCLALYIKAVDVSVTRELCKAHGLPAPAAGDPPATLAAELLRLVRLLPEHHEHSSALDAAESDIPSEFPGVASAQPTVPPKDKRPKRLGPQIELPDCETKRWPNLLCAIASAPLVIVGGPPHLERLSVLPAQAIRQVEWIDTTRQGTHAIGNLERRIRDRRISGIIILEGLVQHRHTDPLISAARSVELAHCFGGKGGRAALLQSLDELESRLKKSPQP
jgi:hypothetical protein